MITFGRTLPITIYPAFWLMAVLLGWLNSNSIVGMAIWVPVIFVSVLIHELGHALTARAFGQDASIDLVALGGLTKRTETQRLPLHKEFLIVLNGPLAGLGLFALAYYTLKIIGRRDEYLTYAFLVAINVNLFWTIVNLLPIQPLDGGKLFSIMMEAIFGFRGVKIALFLSIALAGVLALVCFLFQLVLAGAFFMIFAFESYRAWKSTLPMVEGDTNEELHAKMQQVQRYIEQGRLADAESLARHLRSGTGSGVLHTQASELLALSLGRQNQLQEAYDLLQKSKSHLSDQGVMLLHQLAFRLELWREAADLGTQAFQIAPTPEIAVLNARAYAHLGLLEPTVGWLRAARRAGMSDLCEVLEHPDFEVFRRDPDFLKLS